MRSRLVLTFVFFLNGLSSGGCRGKGASSGVGAEAGLPKIGSALSCQNTGRFPLTQQGGACPALKELAALEANIPTIEIDSGPYSGDLIKCTNLAPYNRGFRFRFRVDGVADSSSMVGDGKGGMLTAVATTLSGANLDANPMCGATILVKSWSERPTISANQIIQVAVRTVPRTDSDSPSLSALYGPDGQVTYAAVFGARLDLFPEDLGDLLPTLTVGSSPNAICASSDAGETLVSVKLATTSGACDVDSHSDRCCSMWGKDYEIQMLNAFGPRKTRPYALVGFVLRVHGLFLPAQ